MLGRAITIVIVSGGTSCGRAFCFNIADASGRKLCRLILVDAVVFTVEVDGVVEF